jgi:TadE-like protein
MKTAIHSGATGGQAMRCPHSAAGSRQRAARVGSPSVRGRQSGMTVVEFALVIPIALLLVFGIVQLGLMYTAKDIVNAGAFAAARAGAFQNAQMDPMTQAFTKAVIPFYQDTTNTNAASRLSQALSGAQKDTCSNGDGSSAGGDDGGNGCFLKIDLLNPTPAAFDDFGITTSASAGHTVIPNDNLEYRPHSIRGAKSQLSIQDANTLRIRVTYGYEIKVPLMKAVFGAIMCGIDDGVKAFGSGNTANVVGGDDCAIYYSKGRIPIVSYATVQMQTPAWQAEGS